MVSRPVPIPSLRPPSRLVANLSRSHTVSSTQASDRSMSLIPSYTMVWLNTGSTVRRTTRVFCRLFLLVSGSTKLGGKGRATILSGQSTFRELWEHFWKSTYLFTYGLMVALIRGRPLHSFTQM